MKALCQKKSLQEIYKELESFRKQSGFTVSYDKTTLYRIGSLRHSDAQMYDMDQFKWSNEDITVLGVTIAHEDIVGKNYKNIVEKARKVIFSWENRGLSLCGKVQVVNTLVASLFVYKMLVLPIIPKEIVKQMDNMIREFIWNGKKSKIAYINLQNSKKDGGLNLVNLDRKDKALKVTWVKTLQCEVEYANLVYHIMRVSGIGEDIWRCNLKKEQVEGMKITNVFWRDVLKCWAEYNYWQEKRTENQIIWYNSEIQIKGKVIFWKDVKQWGLKYVHQLFDKGEFKSEEEVEREYGLTIMRYNSLKSAIPKEWIEFFRKNDKQTYMPIPPHHYDLVCNNSVKNLSQAVYKSLSDDIMIMHNKYVKWKQETQTEFTGTLVEYAKAHLQIYSITNVPKLRSFQYRLLQRGIVTNVHLYKWGKLENDNCTFCDTQAKESLSHLMYTCPVVQILWGKIKEYVKSRYGRGVEMRLTLDGVLLNQIAPRRYRIVNFICLLVKQFIYAQRCLGNQLHANILIQYINKIERIEKYIAAKNSKLDHHNKKWCIPVEEDVVNVVNQYIHDM